MEKGEECMKKIGIIVAIGIVLLLGLVYMIFRESSEDKHRLDNSFWRI